MGAGRRAAHLDIRAASAPQYREVLVLARRYWTALAVGALILGWTVFYLPGSPSFAVLELKYAIDSRDGPGAARFVDFNSVAKEAGYEMLENRGAGDVVNRLVGRGAVELLSGPLAEAARGWAEQKVEEGAKEVQMPAVAVLGALLTLRRDGDNAGTTFHDRRGRVWDITLARSKSGGWQIVKVKNIRQLLEELDRRAAAPSSPR